MSSAGLTNLEASLTTLSIDGKETMSNRRRVVETRIVTIAGVLTLASVSMFGQSPPQDGKAGAPEFRLQRRNWLPPILRDIGWPSWLKIGATECFHNRNMNRSRLSVRA